MGSLRVFREAEMSDGPPTEGMRRATGQVDDRVSFTRATSAPQARSGWHHHGAHTTCAYVLQGRLHLEWGPGGRESADLLSGDFYVMDPETVHRETNPGPDEQVLIAFQLGSGAQVVNVEGPEPEGGAGPHARLDPDDSR